ncbi:hypothetical protein [Streptomyces sp. 1222.5]|uniref:hypothetical protein n=1 Tax=Streptomyces sp. 1222.5 TaxID=1881026 RepID=UPI003EB7497B
MGFMNAWSLNTPGEVHVSFSGHRTACGESVYESTGFNDSKAGDITCFLCGGMLVFDVDTARKAAVEFVRTHPGAREWGNEDVYPFAHRIAERVAGVAWHVKREHGSWNTNHVFSEFMAQGGWMTDSSPEARLIGSTAQAVLEVLTESNE